MQVAHFSALKNCHLFDKMQADTITRLFSGGGCTLHSYHSGAIIAFRGDTYSDLWIIVAGRIAAEFQDYSGKVLKVETLKESEAVATSILFAPENLLPVTLTAETEVHICSIPRTRVIKLLQQEEQFLTNFLQDNGLRLSILAEKLRLVQFSSIREKIASYLLDQADKQGTDSPQLTVTKETLAEIFGVTRPSLSREFSRLCGETILSQEGRQIHILERDELESILLED